MGFVLPFVTGAIWLYVLLRHVWRLRWRWFVRFWLALLLLLVAQYHGITSHFFGTLASPELPRGVLLVLAWAFGVFLLLALLCLVRDVLGGLVWLVARRPGRAILESEGLRRTIGGLALVLSAIGVWQAVRVPDVRPVEIRLAGLPPAFDGYRIVLLSDLHLSRLFPRDWMRQVVARTNAQAADLVVITGDLSDGSPEARADDVRPVADLRARDGVIAVPGNHEYYSDYPRWMAIWRGLGLTMLENDHVLIEHRGATLAVAGVTDRQAASFGQVMPDLGAALQGLPPGMPVILLQHRPEVARQDARAGVMLQLSGHTHGGQILGPHLLTRWANAGFVSGLYQVGAMSMYVSNGAGLWNGLALRLGRPSEITRIVLRAG